MTVFVIAPMGDLMPGNAEVAQQWLAWRYLGTCHDPCFWYFGVECRYLTMWLTARNWAKKSPVSADTETGGLFYKIVIKLVDRISNG
jgi:hypothetical protein